jgi:hypothetical protein
MRPSFGLVSLTLAALAAPLSASESFGTSDLLGGFVDLRLGYEAVLDTSGDANTGTAGDESGVFDMGHRVSLLWIGSLGVQKSGGWLWGLGATYTSMDGVANDTDINLQTWTMQLTTGYAFPVGNHFDLEVLPFIGFGRSYLDLPGASTYYADKVLELGINANAVWTFNNGFQLGATAGFVDFYTSISDTTQRWRFRVDDFMVGGFIGVRL